MRQVARGKRKCSIWIERLSNGNTKLAIQDNSPAAHLIAKVLVVELTPAGVTALAKALTLAAMHFEDKP